ncbi:MAG: DUF5615 family PIN-like protein [Pirellulaceae bacterium]|nr:DUF5615 family PIN-like protein [Pirellulaceae bacterium]
MSLRFFIDMNLSVEWVAEFAPQGWSAVHWSQIGSPTAADREIMAWASGNQHVVFTHDLDFGATLALTHAMGPSVVQVRSQLVLPEDIGTLVALTIRQHETE